ncbi:hypothetical protein BDW02DRAFT_643281 [Decorospora gaudefroyi]|uniref:Gfd2/YDR514C-like C-terminal domain-containing protein n=1 Tax=Decorospora gaudefroyi TaxID=184978 RepID=A0A6A5JYI5_9PLEO|nr:hypothetical protein BDW02DRAFT_643281 [Decorospora gaudefroyi]
MACNPPPTSPSELKALLDTELAKGLTQSAILRHWLHQPNSEIPLGSNAAVSALRNAIIIGLDAEWYEHDAQYITELGLSILSPQTPQPASSSPWPLLRTLQNHYVRIKPHAHLINGDNCSGHPTRFQFGHTSFLSIAAAKTMLESEFSRTDAQGRLRPIIFMGHAVSNDYEVIKSRFGIDLQALGSIVATIDTQVLFSEAVAGRSPPISLKNLLARYEIVEPYLHNAGNDVVCTLVAALLVVFPPARSCSCAYVEFKAGLRDGAASSRCLYGSVVYCEKCGSEEHLVTDCKVRDWFCGFCSKDPGCGGYTHNSERCVARVKELAGVGKGKNGGKNGGLVHAVPCQLCIESTGPERYGMVQAYGHRTEECWWGK